MTGEVTTLPVERLTPSNLPLTCIRVFCDYRKGRGVVVTAYPGDGDSLYITNGIDRVVDGAMARANARRVETYRSAAAAQIGMRSGIAWEAVQEVLAREKLRLANAK
jgi:hypothetical protein